jgi:Cu(I)/Ag(I) efflux system membrane fusion protein
MRKMKIYFPALTILILGLAFQGCQKAGNGEAEASPGQEALPNTVTLTAEALKTAGIKVEPVQFRPAAKKIRVVGDIQFNAKRYAHITSRAAGRIEDILAFPGDKVKQGQPLLNLYSPDFLSLQAELIQASERWKRLKADDGEQATARALFDSVKRKLSLLNVADEELAEIERARTIRPLLAVRAPFSGSIIQGSAVAGDYVELGGSLFKIADLSSLWACVHIYEKDLSLVRPGSSVVIRVGALPGEEFRGSLLLVGDVIDEKTRTIEGRVEVSNLPGKLKPGMYIEADIVSPVERKALFVPEAAIQDYDNKKIVFLRAGENTFSLREVITGGASDGLVEITGGLKEGESVVTGGSFLLKSEMLKKSLGEEKP